MAIEQWGFFSAPHLLWHGASVFMVTFDDRHVHTPTHSIAERYGQMISEIIFWGFILISDGDSEH